MKNYKLLPHQIPNKGILIRITIMLLFVVILSTALVIYYDHQSTITDNHLKETRLGIGFVWPKDVNTPPTLRPQTEEVRIKLGKPFNPLLILQSDSTDEVLVSAFLDYKQVEFVLNGQKDLLHKVEVYPGIDLEIPMSIDITEEGMHDLMVVAFSDPFNKSLDIDFRSSMTPRMVGRRAVVIVGNVDQPVLNYNNNITQGVPVPKDVTLNLGVVFTTLSNSPNSHPSNLDRQLYVTTARPNQRLDFGIWASNLGGNKTVNLAVILLSNFQQVPINGNDVRLITLDPDYEVTIPTSVNLPSEKGVIQLQLIYILDPGKSILNNEVSVPIVLASPRIAVKIVP